MRDTSRLARVALVVALVSAAGCGEPPGAPAGRGAGAKRPGARQDNVILFFAASSTTDAVEEIRAAFEAATGLNVELNFGGSSVLAHQINQGAEADLFLSANVEWADWVTGENRRGQDRTLAFVNLLSNRLVVVVPATSTLEISKSTDLLSPSVEKLALASPDSVPAGRYAKEALSNLGLWEKLEPKVIAGDNVRTALQFVEAGAAEAGIVYATDAAVSSQVRVAFPIDPSLHTPVRYPLLLLRHSQYTLGARQFYDYLRGPEAAAVFEQHGFVVLPQSAQATP